MNALELFKKNKVGLLGLGKSCLATYKFLKSINVDCIFFDDNIKKQEEYKSKGLNIKPLDDWDFENLDFVITSPGIPLYYPKKHSLAEKAEKYNLKILTDVELFYLLNNSSKYIGITGSNGKSSTVSLLEHIFKTAGVECVLGGNIGVPVFELPKLSSNGYYILELSSFQLSLFHNLRFNYAGILNVFPNHDGYHGGFNNYMQDKLKIFDNQTEEDFSFINIDEGYSKEDKAINLKSKVVKISTKGKTSDIYVKGEKLFDKKDEVLDLKEIEAFKGEGFWLSVCFCYAVSKMAKIPTESFIKALKTFKGLEHRQYFLGKYKNITFINDSKATNSKAAALALSNWANIYWLVGGVRKTDTLECAKPFFSKVKKAFIFGKNRDSFEDELKSALNVSSYETMKEAVLDALKEALELKEEVTILLSPVGTSYDEFNNFEERGDYFCKLIKNTLNVNF